MRRSFVYKMGSKAGDVSFNVTPLVDCTFLLVIFFILTSQMASDSLTTLSLPRRTPAWRPRPTPRRPGM